MKGFLGFVGWVSEQFTRMMGIFPSIAGGFSELLSNIGTLYMTTIDWVSQNIWGSSGGGSGGGNIANNNGSAGQTQSNQSAEQTAQGSGIMCQKGANCNGYQQVIKDEDRWSATTKAVDVFVDKVINSTTWTSNKDLRDEVKSLWDKGMDINLTKHNSCGYTWPFFIPNTIYLGKCSWTNGCGPLESTLLHESLELLHYDHGLIRACEALVFGHNPYNVNPGGCK
jgi:hypothetical protein